MKIVIKTILLLAVGLLLAFNLLAQKPGDMVGTWIGEATLESEAEPNELTLILEMKDGNLAGNITGQYGTLNEAELKDIELGDGIFKFTVSAIGPGGGELAIVFEMKVEGETMKGTLDIPDMGLVGEWEAVKQ